MKSFFPTKNNNINVLKKDTKKFYPLIAMVLTAFTYCLCLCFLKVIGYGNNTILQSDLLAQYVSFLEMFKQLLIGKNSLWYTFSEYLGSGAILTYAYYTLNPLNLLLLIPGTNPATIIMIIIIIKISLIGYTTEYFLQKGLSLSSPYTILFSMCFALNGFVATLAYHLMWLDAIYMTPIIIYLIMRFVKTGKWLSLVPAYAFLFITNFYMAFIVGIFSGIVFLLYTIYTNNKLSTHKEKISRIAKKSLTFLFSVLLAAGLCSAILIPCACFLFSHIAEDNVSFKELTVYIPELLNTLFVGQTSSLDNSLPFLYSGLPVLLLVPFYFLNNNRRKKEKIYVGILLLFYFISMLLLPLYKFLHAFDYPNFYAFRFSYVISFILVCIAAKEHEDNCRINRRNLALYIIALIVLYSALIPIKNIIRYEQPVNTNFLLCINALLLVAWWFLLCLFPKTTKKILHTVLVFCLIIIELSINGYLCAFKGENLCAEEKYNAWIEDEGNLVKELAPKNNEFYRILIANDFTYNSACLFDIASFNTFSSSDDYTLRMLLNKLGFSVSNRCLESSGSTPITEMLLGVRYNVTVPSTSDEVSYSAHTTYTENPYALSLGYMVSPLIMNYESTNNPFDNQTNLVKLLTGKNYKLYEAPENVTEYGENVEIIRVVDGLAFHRISTDIMDGGYYYNVPHIEGKTFMAAFPTDTPTYGRYSPLLNGTVTGVGDLQLMSCGGIITATIAGNNNDQELICVYFNSSVNDYEYKNAYFTYYLCDSIEDVYNDLSQNQLNITNFSDDRIEGNVTSTKDRNVLFLSIPYDDSWTVTIDGTPSTVYKALEDAFCCVVLPEEGEHHIVLEYKAAGAETGQLISIVSLSVYILAILYNAVTHKKKTQKSK